MNRAEEIVQKQLDAYNKKGIHTWLSAYDKNAVQYSTEGVLLASGPKEMEKICCLDLRRKIYLPN